MTSLSDDQPVDPNGIDPKHVGDKEVVFLSYARKDRYWRDRIQPHFDKLRAIQDTKLFIDTLSIHPGDGWEDKLEESLNAATVALFLVSKNWLSSEWCQKEWNRCFARNQKEGKTEPKILWVSLDGETPADTTIQALWNGNTSLVDIEEKPLIDGVLQWIAESVFDVIDPLWRKLQDKLPKKYRLLRKLADGATNAVYLAGDRSLYRRVVIRAVHDSRDEDRFDALVQRSATLSHCAGMITVLGAWLDEHPHCCVVEYIEGDTLRRRLAQDIRWSVTSAIDLVSQIGSAVVDAHSKGVHHRDLRPSKVMVDDDGRAFISGFSQPEWGVGESMLERVKNKACGDDGETPEFCPTSILGPEQVAYLVPEHFYPLRSDTGYDQSDQYQLGLMLWELITGRLPETLENFDAVSAGARPEFKPVKCERDNDDRVLAWCPDCLLEVISRMVSINPKDRYVHLVDALDALAAVQPIDECLARESYERCTRDREREFFTGFYERLRKRLRKVEKEKPGGKSVAEIFELIAQKSAQQHALLKQAIFTLFAFVGSPREKSLEPNVLTRLAVSHRDEHAVPAEWYDIFLEVLCEKIIEADAERQGSNEIQGIFRYAIRATLGPGIEYMKRYAKDVKAPGAGPVPEDPDADDLPIAEIPSRLPQQG